VIPESAEELVGVVSGSAAEASAHFFGWPDMRMYIEGSIEAQNGVGGNKYTERKLRNVKGLLDY
jgi:hypothetical protein